MSHSNSFYAFHARYLSAVASWTVACGGPPTASPATGLPGASSSSAQDSNSTNHNTRIEHTGTTGNTGNTEAPVRFDLNRIGDASAPASCQAVDFLFVIDNSGSMNDHQQNLVSNFPTFIEGIQSTLGAVDSYHVGVVTTDDYGSEQPECGALGTLVTRTMGENSSNLICGPYVEGHNYMTELDNLSLRFGCAAAVGTSGAGVELTMSATEAAISEILASPGACNHGFIREDALLVLVLITDEADGPGDPEETSPGNPISWYESIVTAKQGRAENAVVVVLTNYDGSPCPPSDDIGDGQNLVGFANLFGENGFSGGICVADYEPLFSEAVDVISTACDNFVVPQG